MPVAILLSRPGPVQRMVTSRVNRFYTEERPSAIQKLILCEHDIRLDDYRIGKFTCVIEKDLYEKLRPCRLSVEMLAANHGKGTTYYQEACRYWVKAFDRLPAFKRNGKRVMPPHGRTIRFPSLPASGFVTCLLNSSLFYWYYSAFSDCEHINDLLIRKFLVPDDWERTGWTGLCGTLVGKLLEDATRKTIKTKQGHTIEYEEINVALAKTMIDRIDFELAKHYGFTDEELDFVINYDIKYRMGQDDVVGEGTE